MDMMDLVELFLKSLTTIETNQSQQLTTIQIIQLLQVLKELLEKCQGLGQQIQTGNAKNHNHEQNEEEAESEEQGPQKFRENIPFGIFQHLTTLSAQFKQHDDQPYRHEFYACLFRFGRNVAVNCKTNQEALVKSGLIAIPIKFLEDVLQKLPDKATALDLVVANDVNIEKRYEREEEIKCVRLALQMTCNCMAGNPEIADKLVKDFDLFRLILKTLSSFEDDSIIQYAAMNGCTINSLLGFDDLLCVPASILKHILNKLEKDSFLEVWFLELLSAQQYIPTEYNQLDKELRTMVLDNIIQHDYVEKLHVEAVKFFQNIFKETSSSIISSELNQVCDLISVELSYLVQIFCRLIGEGSSNDNDNNDVTSVLQSDDDFAVSANKLLKTVHLAGKLPEENSLTPLETLDSVSEAVKNKDSSQGPTYLLKSNLIRLVGSLSYRHKSNQAKVLEHDTLAIILECTKIDGRNPFIPQCSVFALKCLLEDNQDNQDFVKSTSKISEIGPLL